jgi:hypothetical protein
MYVRRWMASWSPSDMSPKATGIVRTPATPAAMREQRWARATAIPNATTIGNSPMPRTPIAAPASASPTLWRLGPQHQREERREKRGRTGEGEPVLSIERGQEREHREDPQRARRRTGPRDPRPTRGDDARDRRKKAKREARAGYCERGSDK